MSETAQAARWIISTAQADSSLMTVATGGTWQDVADIGVVAPYFLCQQQSGIDVLTANGIRLFSHLLWQIKMIGPSSSYAALETGANRIDALFGSVRLQALSPGYMLDSIRQQPVAYHELVNGQPWSHLGGLFAIDLQGT